MDSLTEELNRIKSKTINSRPYDNSAGMVCFRITCLNNSSEVLRRVKEVLELVISIRLKDEWPELDSWKSILPNWFTSKCADEMSKEEAEKWLKKWRSLFSEEKARLMKEQPWSLLDWLHWFMPGQDERQWRWIFAEIIDGSRFRVVLSVEGFPTAYGAFEWLLRASGGITIEEE